MQSAQARRRNYGCLSRWLWLDRPTGGRVFAETIVKAIFVVVIHIITDQPAEMRFIQRDDVVEDLSPATSHPSFRDSILPRRLYARPFGLHSRGLQEVDDFVIESRIVIEDGAKCKGLIDIGRK